MAPLACGPCLLYAHGRCTPSPCVGVIYTLQPFHNVRPNTAVVSPRLTTLHPRSVGSGAERFLLETLERLSSPFATPAEPHLVNPILQRARDEFYIRMIEWGRVHLAYHEDASAHLRAFFEEFPQAPLLSVPVRFVRGTIHNGRRLANPPVSRGVHNLLREQDDHCPPPPGDCNPPG